MRFTHCTLFGMKPRPLAWQANDLTTTLPHHIMTNHSHQPWSRIWKNNSQTYHYYLALNNVLYLQQILPTILVAFENMIKTYLNMFMLLGSEYFHTGLLLYLSKYVGFIIGKQISCLFFIMMFFQINHQTNLSIPKLFNRNSNL